MLFRSSYHYHKIKDEVLYLASGSLLFMCSQKPIEHTDPKPGAPCNYSEDLKFYDQVTLNKGQAWHVAPLYAHQFRALEDSEIIEFSTHHDDEDSYRITSNFVDDHYYGREIPF